jgi:hypothetical protein
LELIRGLRQHEPDAWHPLRRKREVEVAEPERCGTTDRWLLDWRQDVTELRPEGRRMDFSEPWGGRVREGVADRGSAGGAGAADENDEPG